MVLATLLLVPGLVAIVVSFVVFALFRRGLLVPNSSSRMFQQERPSFTAELVCIFRAIGTSLNWCDDPFAFEFCELDAKIVCSAWIHLRKLLGSTVPLYNVPYMCTRTIFLDRFVLEVPVQQVVILGAGLDSRPYRLRESGDSRTKYFEVDAPATQKQKKAKVANLFSKQPKLFTSPAYSEGRVIYVSCNFATESFLDKLVENGFDPKNSNTVILLEGVASYLTWPELKQTLSFVAQCAAGTRFVLNCLEGSMRKSSTSKLLKSFVGEEWKFSLAADETGASRFGPVGFDIIREINFDQAQAELPVLRELPRSRLESRMVFMKVADK